MAKTQQKDLLTRFQDLGAEALHKLADVPGGSKFVELANDTKTRLDEMQKKLRGLDELEKQLAAETKKAARKSSATRKPPAGGPRRETAPKPPA